MKLRVPIFLAALVSLYILPLVAADLQGLEEERELRRLAKIKAYGEPLVLEVSPAATSVSFSHDGRFLAVSAGLKDQGKVIVYDLPAERTKKFDREVELLRANRLKTVPQI